MAASMKMKPALLSLFIFAVFVGFSCVTSHEHGHAHGEHGHAHDHGDGHAHGDQKPAHFKYSQAANEAGNEAPSSGHEHNHGQPADGAAKQIKDTGATLWLIACGSTAMVSVAPVFILLFIPIDSTDTAHQSLLRVLLAFASGGLLGDAFLHLIPHAISPHSHTGDEHGHDHGHSHGGHGHDHSHDMGVGLWVLSGIVAFLMVEKFVRYVKGGHGHSHGSHSHAAADKKSEDSSKDKSSVRQRKKSDSQKEKKTEITQEESTGDIKVSGYLNLAADFAHNFTDGLAIGASYLAGRNIGIITTITILFHEIPHEVGDFAILVQSGCTKKKAMMLQFTTAFGAMLGTVVSLLAEGIGDAAVAWILPFTAGGFIYIATVSVIPELLEDCKPWQTLKELIAIVVGVYMMVLIAEYE